MYTLYIGNAFSLSMLSRDVAEDGGYTPVPVHDPRAEIAVFEKAGHAIVSCVGHQDTAHLFSKLLGREIPCNRVSVKLVAGSAILVGQYVGPRLPEGATELPEGASIEWWIV